MNLKSKATHGVKWTSASMLVTTILQFSQLAILARFLTPEQFGLMALVTVVIGFSQAFVDMGMSNAIIHKQTNCQLHLSTLFWLTLLAGICITGLVFLSAPLVANFYESPELKPLIQLVSLAFVISALGNQHKVLFQKELQFKVIAIVELCSVCCAFIVAISMAALNFGVYALVFANITMTLVSSMLFFILGARSIYVPKFHFRWYEARGYVGFGAYQMGERTINYFSANVDKILIGKFLGVHSVGLYNVAWQLIIFPLSKLNPVINKVALPVYGKIQKNPQAIDDYYSLAMKAIGLIVIPFSIYLLFFSMPVVSVVFGPQWIDASMVVSLLGVVGLVKAIGNPGGALVVALGNAKLGFWWNVIWASAVLCCLYFALMLSPQLETTPYVLLVLTSLFGVVWHCLVYKLTGVNYRPILSKFAFIVLYSVVICTLATVIVIFFGVLSPLNKVIISASVFMFTYVPYLLLYEIRPLLSSRRREV
ncbi:MOP flippase family protein [Vibrio sp. 16]|uniref:MOP flippase family protein n=1 Tax=Vibrio sp. 16 TaxID=391586 RepID=UPI0002D2BF51|nr:MOP flippase family protein [Vibrio sp. 16]CAK4070477.1 hypothetical protein VDT1_2482 [Vibrio sp. 16]